MENSRLAKIVETAKGERSIREYSADSGVNPTTISKIISKGYIPSSGILKRLASPEAKPRGNVSLQDMMIAAGYSDDYIKPDYLITGDNGTTILVETKDQKELDDQTMERLSVSASISEFRQTIRRFEAVATGIIYSALASRSIQFIPGRTSELNIMGARPDIYVELPGGPVKTWWFDFKKMRHEKELPRRPKRLLADMILGHYILLPPDKERKLSVVVDNEYLFDAVLSYKGIMSYKGNLSVILIDLENVNVVREEYIAFYDDDSENRCRIKLI